MGMGTPPHPTLEKIPTNSHFLGESFIKMTVGEFWFSFMMMMMMILVQHDNDAGDADADTNGDGDGDVEDECW